ncbi:MAG TPA: hypothetical protein VFX59_27175 [Polyangiales bacterium]|nr:hypothetical protein [Polyangiales bacterium]
MRWLAWLCLAGCTREPWQRAVPAAFVPALELRAAYRVKLDERVELGVGAWLRWTPRTAASAVASQVDQAPAVWLAPCALDDVTCFTELAEAEREIANALRERP